MKSIRQLAFAGAALAMFASGQLRAEDATPSSSTETYNDWNLACATMNVPAAPAAAAAATDPAKKDQAAPAAPAAAAAKSLCEVSQIYNNKKNGGEVARISFFYDPMKKDQVNAGLRVLVDVTFDKPVRVMDGDKELLKGSFKRCAGNFCYAVFENAGAQLASLGAASNMSFEYPISTGQLLRIPMSSKGLTAAMAALKTHQ